MAATPLPLTTARRRGRTILLTGASGVVGSALLPRLAGHRVVALGHRATVAGPNTEVVRGDVTRADLGLDPETYRTLAARVDAVIHAAAVTTFNRDDGSLEVTNVDGTRHIAAFAAAADAPLYHVSTAFLHADHDREESREALRYAASKRAAEAVVAASGVPHTIVRPSVVVGDSTSGEITAFQGIYRVAGALLRGYVPILPFAPHWRIDLVGCDDVAAGIAAAVEHDIVGETLWLTAGDGAPSLREAVDLTVAFGRDLGLAVTAPRFVTPELFDRLIGPVFIDALPPKIRGAVTQLLDVFAAYMAREQAFPSSFPALSARTGCGEPPPWDATFARSLAYWAEASDLTTWQREGVA